eukprot:scaffold1190_cov393-Prasinococcus_capsulatus_cf.AAC.15
MALPQPAPAFEHSTALHTMRTLASPAKVEDSPDVVLRRASVDAKHMQRLSSLPEYRNSELGPAIALG